MSKGEVGQGVKATPDPTMVERLFPVGPVEQSHQFSVAPTVPVPRLSTPIAMLLQLLKCALICRWYRWYKGGISVSECWTADDISPARVAYTRSKSPNQLIVVAGCELRRGLEGFSALADFALFAKH